jgi:hypothetical protein
MNEGLEVWEEMALPRPDSPCTYWYRYRAAN